MIRLTGMEAIAYAMEYDLELCHHSDGAGGFRDDLDVEEARHIAQDEPSMIYLDINED
ncbi:MAG: hypothetical protein HRU15_01700 [Planctomycetes bacterium]|nr:hypothetical protein [Planctomycetota bacterium]